MSGARASIETMDPDTALANARIGAALINSATDDDTDDGLLPCQTGADARLREGAEQLSSAFMALDLWLSQAGVPPAEWLKGRDDGEVIDVAITTDQLLRALVGSDMPSGIVIVALDE